MSYQVSDHQALIVIGLVFAALLQGLDCVPSRGALRYEADARTEPRSLDLVHAGMLLITLGCLVTEAAVTKSTFYVISVLQCYC